LKHETFHYRSLQEVKDELARLGLCLPLSGDTDILGTPFHFGNVTLRNRLCIAPMEGADSTPEGCPAPLTRERYIQFALGGASVIWFESVSVTQEGRSSPSQLLLTKETLPGFQRLLDEVKETGLRENGYAPYIIMQANHSGRYSKPNGASEPIIAYHHPEYEAAKPVGHVDSSCIASDGYLRKMEEKFGEAALLCRQAGFDAVDIKSCHGYLLAELSSAYTREGEYGGSFENRFRLHLNAVKNAKLAETKDFLVTMRLGIHDGFAYPYGFGMAEDGSLAPD